MMYFTRFASATLVLFFVCTLQCVAQFAPSLNSVQVTSEQGLIHLKVTSPAALNRVLEQLCHQTYAQCEGVDTTSSVVVSTQEIVGDWGEIMSRLLEGSNLNYVVSMPSHGTAGHLFIQGPAAQLETSAITGSHQPSQSFAGRDEQIQEVPQEQGIASVPEQVANQEPTAPAQSSEPSTSLGEQTGASSSIGSSGVTATQGGNVLPFPDSHGNPIAAGSQPSQYLPFPDSHGNPIPVRNEPDSYQPFPDSHGNLIPIVNQPSPYLPFPDSHGNPIPTRPD